MKRSFTASISQEGEWYIARCMQVDVASQGATEDEALDDLRDALELHFTPPVATIIPRLRDIEIDIKAASSRCPSAKSNANSKRRALKKPDRLAVT